MCTVNLLRHQGEHTSPLTLQTVARVVGLYIRENFTRTSLMHRAYIKRTDGDADEKPSLKRNLEYLRRPRATF